MPTAFADSDQPEVPLTQAGRSRIKAMVGMLAAKRWAGMAIAASSLIFAALQSICAFFAAVDGLRLGIGIGISSLILASSTADKIDSFHVDWLRVPMLALALTGSLLNLLVLWQVRRLRRNPAARWRQRPVSPRRLRMERVQLALSILTLALIAIEERQHLLWLGHL